MLLEELLCLSVILNACHNEKRNPRLSLSDNIKKIVNKALKDKKLLINADIKHSLRLVEAQTASLTAGKENSTDLSISDCLNSGFSVLLSVFVYFLDAHSKRRLKAASFIFGNIIIEN